MSQSAKLSRRKMPRRAGTNHDLQSENLKYQRPRADSMLSNHLKNTSSSSLLSPPLNRVDIHNKLRVEARHLVTGSSNGSFTSVMSPVINRAKYYERFHPGSPLCTTRSFSRTISRSPCLYRMKERVGSTSSQSKECWYGGFEKSHFAQDLDSFKEAHVKKYLSVDYENIMPHFYGSELDTRSTCGQCGQSKVFGSQRLGWCTSEHTEITDIISARNDLTDSLKEQNSDKDMSRELYVSRLETSGSYDSTRKQSQLDRLLCWKGESLQQDMSENTSSLSNTKFVSIMFDYKREYNDLCIKLHDISSVMEAGCKAYKFFIKVYLMPGKVQCQISSIFDKKQPGKYGEFHINLPVHELSGYDLVVKLCKRQSFVSLAKSIAKTRIPLHRHDFSTPAFAVFNLNN